MITITFFTFSAFLVKPICSLSLLNKQATYNYFAYGSNMALTTMTDLRNIEPISYTPAVLPFHKLVFNLPGIPFVEPSAASVEPMNSFVNSLNNTTLSFDNNETILYHDISVVHGILYTLSEQDFVKVCQTEGVPFSYRLHRCQLIPYTGDGYNAGRLAFEQYQTERIATSTAFTLRSMPLRRGSNIGGNSNNYITRNNIPPSQAYMNVLIRGAREFGLDADYLQELEQIPVGPTLFGDGIAENMLRAAEERKKQFSKLRGDILFP